MTEWSVFEILAGVIGLFLAVGAPVLKLHSVVVKQAVLTETLVDRLDTIAADKTEAHRRLWEHNTGQDEKIADHETRIKVLEETKG